MKFAVLAALPIAIVFSHAYATGQPQVLGRVVNAENGKALAGIDVQLRNRSGSVVAQSITNNLGEYQVESAVAGEYFIRFSGTDIVSIDERLTVQSSTATVVNEALSTPLLEDELRIVMSWCGPNTGGSETAQVRDVDAYLRTPQTLINYQNERPRGADAQMDHDSTEWYGPETITISALHPGVYKYYVNNFSKRDNRAALGNSQVRVAVYRGDHLVKQYQIPPGFGLTYEVFDIIHGQIIDRESYSQESEPVF